MPPKLRLFLFLAVSLVSAHAATLEDCQVCAWPYTTDVNSDGECYPTYQGYQSGLSTGCLAYCNTYQNQADTLQSVSSVYSFIAPSGGAGPYCECVRVNKGAFVSYKVRPQSACEWGQSNANKAYYDSVAVNWRSSKTDSNISALKTTTGSDLSAQAAALAAQGYTYMGCGAAAPIGDAYLNPDAVWFYQVSTNTSTFLPFPAGKTCVDFHSGAFGSVPAAIENVLERVQSTDTAIRRIDDAVRSVSQSVNATQDNILSAIAHSDSAIMSRLAAGTGGGAGADVDLGPVYTAISASRDSVVNALNGVGNDLRTVIGTSRDSILTELGKMEDDFASRHLEVMDSLTSLSGTLNGIPGKLGELIDTVSSGNASTGLKLTYLSDTVSAGNSRTGAAMDRFMASVDSLLNRGYDLDEATKVVFDSMYNALTRSEGVSRQQLDSSVAGFGRLHGDLRAIKDSLKITVVDSSDNPMDTLNIGRLVDTVHNFHSDFRNLSDSITKWQSNRERLGDSLYTAWGVDSVFNSDPYSNIDTNALKEEADSYFDALRSAASAESTFVVGMVENDGTCTDFPSDPKYELAFLGYYEVTIPMAQAHPTMFSFMRTIVYLTAYFIGFLFWVKCLGWALDMNRWMTYGSGRLF